MSLTVFVCKMCICVSYDNYDKKIAHILMFWFGIKLTVVFHSNQLCIVYNINMEGTVSQNIDIRIRFKDIEK